MRRRRFSDEQIAGIQKEHEAGEGATAVCRLPSQRLNLFDDRDGPVFESRDNFEDLLDIAEVDRDLLRTTTDDLVTAGDEDPDGVPQ